MGYNFISCDRDQQFLMPPSLDEWLPKDHLARFVVEMVDLLDLSAFYARRRDDGWGRAAYDPKMMVALLIYAYATCTRSSRKIETRLVEDVAFRFIAANETPDHATVARFAKDHEQELADLTAAICRATPAKRSPPRTRSPSLARSPTRPPISNSCNRWSSRRQKTLQPRGWASRSRSSPPTPAT